MNPVEAALAMAATDLDERGVAWALVGGVAVRARAEPRMTRDVDIAVAFAADSEAPLFALQQRGWGESLLGAPTLALHPWLRAS